MIVPALYETDDGAEANGVVHPFCSDTCRDHYRRSHLSRGLRVLAGETHTEPFGFIPQCDTCGTPLRPCEYTNWGQPCILVAGTHGDDHVRSLENSMRTLP